jgi:hypothetical protein
MKKQTKKNIKRECKHSFDSDGGQCIKCRKTVADLFSEGQNLEEKIKMDICVLCGKITDYPVNMTINLRKAYVEGAGQLCEGCYNNLG